jgi:hypothetical protein
MGEKQARPDRRVWGAPTGPWRADGVQHPVQDEAQDAASAVVETSILIALQRAPFQDGWRCFAVDNGPSLVMV